MEKNPFKWSLSIIAGISILCTEILFNLPAYLQWPTGDFSLLTNWHSDLGNSNLNTPLGAQIYNAGQVFQGLSLILFAGGLYVLYTKEKWIKYLIIAGQITCFFLGISMIMNGIFSEDFEPAHSDWSELIFLCIIASEFLISSALLKHPKFKKLVVYIGFISGVVNIILLFGPIENFYLMEYIAIYTAEIWLGLMTINIFINEVWTIE